MRRAGGSRGAHGGAEGGGEPKRARDADAKKAEYRQLAAQLMRSMDALAKKQRHHERQQPQQPQQPRQPQQAARPRSPR